MNTKFQIIGEYIKYSVRVFKQLKKGQKKNFDLLQLSHRLEKGLTIEDPKPLWGWDKARKIAQLINNSEDDFSTRTASAVLSAYLDAKSHSKYPEDVSSVTDFIKEEGFTPIEYFKKGGTQVISAVSFSEEETEIIEKLFISRHSVRDFSGRCIPKEVILRAVDMAQRCPSACNRQPYKCYIIDANQRRKELPSIADYNADKYLVITGDIRAFVNTEINDWIVSPVIFASYLTLSLHAYGIGSCVLKKQLVSETDFERNFRQLSGIDESEVIILEIAIGYYKDQYTTPISLRADAEDIVKFI